MPESSPNLITEPAAIVGGPAAFLLSRFLRSGPVIACMRTARWFGGPDVAEALHAIHEAGSAWETNIELRERNDVVRCELPGPNLGTLTVMEASDRLGIGERRVQQLAQRGRITGHRVGGRWQLDQQSVNIYHHQRQQKQKVA
jgi:excisionase family DNA binding protein